MKARRSLVCAAAAFLATFAFGRQVPGGQNETKPQIPVTVATTLSGQTIHLPQDLPSHALLILGFSQKSSSDSTECGKRLHEALSQQVEVKVFQMPVLESVPKLMRGFITRSMKNSVPVGLQSTFLPVFDHEADWKRLTGFASPDDAYILLTGLQGRVLWRTHGPCSADKVRTVMSELEKESRPAPLAP